MLMQTGPLCEGGTANTLLTRGLTREWFHMDLGTPSSDKSKRFYSRLCDIMVVPSRAEKAQENLQFQDACCRGPLLNISAKPRTQTLDIANTRQPSRAHDARSCSSSTAHLLAPCTSGTKMHRPLLWRVWGSGLQGFRVYDLGPFRHLGVRKLRVHVRGLGPV